MRFASSFMYPGLASLIFLTVKVTAEDCIIANAICRNALGGDSFCRGADQYCQGTNGNAVTCTCGIFLEVGTAGIDYDDYIAPDFPFVGNNYPNITIIAQPNKPVPTTTTSTEGATTTTSEADTTSTTADPPTSTEEVSTDSTGSDGSNDSTTGIGFTTVTTTAEASTVTTTTTSTTTTTTTTTITTTTTTTGRTTMTAPAYDGASMYVWTEWPTMYGEDDWIQYYSQLLTFLQSSKIKINKVILRILDPTFGSIAKSHAGVTAHDLWSISLDSVLYRNFLSKLPPGVTELHVLPYLLDQPNRENWQATMGVSNPLECVFKYLNAWNTLLGYEIFQGIVVDAEEKRGFLEEINSVPSYKIEYSIAAFGYCTGYTQVGVLSVYADVVDAFYFQMYDFYVRDSATLQLVQNSDVGVDQSGAYISVLNDKVWKQYLPYYEHAKANFMWSVQDSANTDCLYPDTPTTCGIKKDFGAGWSIDGYLNFISDLKAMYPSKFGNKPHGLFQFSFIPNDWY